MRALSYVKGTMERRPETAGPHLIRSKAESPCLPGRHRIRWRNQLWQFRQIFRPPELSFFQVYRERGKMLIRNSLTTMLLVAITLVSGMSTNCFGDEPPNSHLQRVQELLQERHDVLAQRVEMLEVLFKGSVVSPIDVSKARDELFAAKLELAQSRDERVAILKEQVANLQQIEKYCQVLVERGVANMSDVLEAKSNRLRVEIELERTLSKE